MLIRFFTDGACSGNPGPGGWAFIIYDSNGCKKVSGNECETTNNRMELTAVVEALRYICDNSTMFDVCEIISDSSYVVNAINNQWISRWTINGWKTTRGDDIKNKDLWLSFKRYISIIDNIGIPLSFKKVKGHSGNTFNEQADEEARRQCELAKEEGGMLE